MSNLLRSTTETALHIVSVYMKKKESPVIVDATCGRGNDTLALLKMVAEKNDFRIFAFDIQREAIHSTQRLLQDEGFGSMTDPDGSVRIIQESHVNLDKYVEKIDGAVFNLGYLPGGDKSVTTETSESIEAVMKAVKLLAVDGIIAVTMYEGHEEGAIEKAKLLKELAELDSRTYHVAFSQLINQKNNPPETVFITRKV